jgi:methylphosphotriester-DNA--protein-cysteine methyltransferase
MILHKDTIGRKLALVLRNKAVVLAGNKKLKIYGTLTCKSGKRMKKENRVFFESEYEAVKLGYRPCGHCLKLQYEKWLFDKFT